MIILPRITIVELHRYREWTEKIGYDREWIIQDRQSSFYNLLQKIFSKYNGFAIPLRYDYYIVLSNGISREVHLDIHNILSKKSPVTVRMVSVPHPYPLIGQLIGTQVLSATSSNFVFYEGEEDPVVLMHIDVNGITRMTYETSIYEAYTAIIEFFSYVADTVLRYGGIASYLGGDNILAVLPVETYEDYLSILPDYVKIGVGISLKPRKAMELATRALDEIRRKRENKYIVYSDSTKNV